MTSSQVGTAMTRAATLNLLQHHPQHQRQQPHSMVSSSPTVRLLPTLNLSLPFSSFLLLPEQLVLTSLKNV